MDLIEDPPELPRLTRLIRAISWCAVEGMSLGLAGATSVQATNLAQFVMTNQTPAVLRKEMLAFVILPTLLLPALIAVASAIPRFAGKRLRTFERFVRLLTPLASLGFLPLVFKPSIWHEKSLAFLLVTALFSFVTVGALRVFARELILLRPQGRKGDLSCLADAVKARFSSTALSNLYVFLLIVVALWCATRPVDNLKAEATGLANELSTIRRVSEFGGMGAWFSVKAIRAIGHVSCLGLVDSIVIWLWSGLRALLFLRVLAVSLAAVPLFLWYRRHLGVVPALIASVAFLSMPLQGVLELKDSFPLNCAMGCFFAAAHLFEIGKLRRALAFVVVGIAINEQVALWFALLGVFLVSTGTRKALGKWLAVACAGYFFVIALLVLPAVGVTSYALDPANTTLIGVNNLAPTLTALVVNPTYALSRWFEAQTLEYWLALCVPMAFLPFLTRRWIIWLAPALLFSMSLPSQDAGSQWRDPAYAHFLALAFLATVAGLRAFDRSETTGRVHLHTALVGWIAALAPCVSMFGSLLHRHP
jgi:hypothetical protein